VFVPVVQIGNMGMFVLLPFVAVFGMATDAQLFGVVLGAINVGNANGGTNWPGGGYDPETHIVYAQANASSVAAVSLAPPPPGFSDLPYQAGVVGQPFRLREAAGSGTYADAVRTPERAASPPPPLCGWPKDNELTSNQPSQPGRPGTPSIAGSCVGRCRSRWTRH